LEKELVFLIDIYRFEKVNYLIFLKAVIKKFQNFSLSFLSKIAWIIFPIDWLYHHIVAKLRIKNFDGCIIIALIINLGKLFLKKDLILFSIYWNDGHYKNIYQYVKLVYQIKHIKIKFVHFILKHLVHWFLRQRDLLLNVHDHHI